MDERHLGWVEPTARAVLALRILRPDASVDIGDGLRVIADRECVDGGWNAGNSVVYGVAIPPYAQTTAIALIAIQGALAGQRERGVRVLRELWPVERGGLTLALALAAFRLSADPMATAVEEALGRTLEETELLDDVVALAWATVATGDGLEVFRWAAT